MKIFGIAIVCAAAVASSVVVDAASASLPDDNIAADDEAIIANHNIDPDTSLNRHLQTTPTAEWHPNYAAGWTAGHCIYTIDTWTPGYATELACCKGSYAGQSSGHCLASLPSPPTTSPTDSGGLDVYYPDYTKPFGEGYCINARPLPMAGSRPLFETMLACCKGAYLGQMSGKCLSMLPNPPTASPTDSGGLDVWYPDYSINDYSQGYCINERPLPNGRVTYATPLACCQGAYGSQSSGKCLSMVPGYIAPTPTTPGEVLGVYYPDYSKQYSDGICINTSPLPNGRRTYTSQAACCQAAYGSQSSLTCICNMPNPPTPSACPGYVTYTTTVTTTTTTVTVSSQITLANLVLPTDEAEKAAVIDTLEETITALVSESLADNQSIESVTIISIGGVPVNQRRSLFQTLLDRILSSRSLNSDGEVEYEILVREVNTITTVRDQDGTVVSGSSETTVNDDTVASGVAELVTQTITEAAETTGSDCSDTVFVQTFAEEGGEQDAAVEDAVNSVAENVCVESVETEPEATATTSEPVVETIAGTKNPTPAPTTPNPTSSPTTPSPTASPTTPPPTTSPTTAQPTKSPTLAPTNTPTASPTFAPTNAPTPKPTNAPVPAGTCETGGIMVPLYVFPTTDGTTCTNNHYMKIAAVGASGTQVIAIVNPNNGPDYGGNAATKNAYDICIAYLQSNNVEVIGYIHTKVGYPNISGYRAMADIKADIDSWNTNFNVDGIFIDEVTNRWPIAGFDSEALAVATYNEIVNYVLNTANYDRAVMNPGGPYYEAIMSPYYGNQKVITVLFENEGAKYMPQDNDCLAYPEYLWDETKGSFPPGPWCPYVPTSDGIEAIKNVIGGSILPGQSAVMLYSSENSVVKTNSIITSGLRQGVSWFYVTDSSTPWSETPSQAILDAQKDALACLDSTCDAACEINGGTCKAGYCDCSQTNNSGSSNCSTPRASWMSGYHGIGYRIPGGTSWASTQFHASALANQIQGSSVKWVIFGLSSGAFGDRYVAPHPKLAEIGMRATTPKSGIDFNTYSQGNPASKTFDLPSYPDMDMFDDMLTQMEAIGVKVIAYFAAQGPAMLKAGEGSSFDNPIYAAGQNTGGYFVDSATQCPNLGAPDGQCSPSLRKWVNWVASTYSVTGHTFDSNASTGVWSASGTAPIQVALKDAYADHIFGHYVKKYGDRIAGFWFDQGGDANRDKIFSLIREYNPDAVVAWNEGSKIPLRNNNPNQEDYTYGHMLPHKSNANPPDGCYNYGMVLSAEASDSGFVYSGVTPSVDYGVTTTATSNPYSDPSFQITYDTSSSNPSLAHVYLPFQEMWNSGEMIWDPRQAKEWMKRVTDAGGAFTWAVRRTGCGGCSSGSLEQAKINDEDWAALQVVFGLDVSDGYQFDSTNCECLSTFGTNPSTLSWGCDYIPPPEECTNDGAWRFEYTTESFKGCNFVCKGAHQRCCASYVGTDLVNAINACPYCCKSNCDGWPGYINSC